MRTRLLPLLLLALAACTSTPPARAPTHEPSAPGGRALHLVFTTDEHGWLVPLVDKEQKVARGGVAALYDRLTGVEGYSAGQHGRDEGWLLLSAGDMWTGPYESTVLEGAPMVAAMNHMGYAAAAVGNHEFDFGTRVLGERAKAAKFPLLAANLVERTTGARPAWAEAFTIVEAGGVRVGIVGLTNEESPVTADPRHMTGLRFLPYATSLERWLPEAKKAGAEELVVLLHDDLVPQIDEILPVLQKHKVRVVAFGHHHQQSLTIHDAGTPDLDDDVVACNAGAFMRSYCRVDLAFEGGALAKREAKIAAVETPEGAGFAADPELSRIVANAEASANQIGGEVLVQSKQPLKRGPYEAMGQLVVDAWLDALPYAHVAVTNAGGIRQDLPAGPVRMRDVVSVMPFNNYLLVVDLTGAQLKEVLASQESVAGGVRFTFKDGGDQRVIESVVDSRSGKPIPDDARLKVVINDFMYRGGDRYRFQAYDAEPEETAIDWREPVLRRLREMGTRSEPLDRAADERAKKR